MPLSRLGATRSVLSQLGLPQPLPISRANNTSKRQAQAGTPLLPNAPPCYGMLLAHAACAQHGCIAAVLKLVQARCALFHLPG